MSFNMEDMLGGYLVPMTVSSTDNGMGWSSQEKYLWRDPEPPKKRPIDYTCPYCGTKQRFKEDYEGALVCVKCGAPVEDEDDDE